MYNVFNIPTRKKSKIGADIKTEQDIAEITDSDIDINDICSNL